MNAGKIEVERAVEPEVNETFGKYKLIKKLPSGMAEVFLAEQELFEGISRKVVIKRLPPTFPSEFRQMFLDEAKIMSSLSNPYIVQIYDWGQYNGSYFICMEYVEGYSLKDIIERRGIIAPRTAARYAIQICEALDIAHKNNLIHRDIKPANILMEKKTNRAMISDFGIARVVRGEDLQAGMIVGTPLYMSPEQAMGKQLDARTDIYAVGCVLFLLAAGELPVRKEDGVRTVMRKAKVPESFFIRKPSEVNPAIDLDLEKIILKATAANRDERYKDCGQFARHLMWYKEKHFKEEIAPPEDL